MGTSQRLNFYRFVILSFSLAFAPGCKWITKPTYPAATVARSLVEICQKENKLTVQARLEGKSLQIFVWKPGLMESGSGAIKEDTEDALDKVTMVARRVVMSTDAKIDFIEVKVADALSGASVSRLFYVPDILGVTQNRISLEEYFNRMVTEMTPASEDGDAAKRWVVWEAPITFEQFVAKQILLRVRRESSVSLDVHEDLSIPSTLAMVVDNWDSIKALGADEIQKTQTIFENAARHVIGGYNFHGFTTAVLKDARGVALNAWGLR